MNKYGFVYLWYDVKHKRYYIGCHWGDIHDGYICSSNWMRDAYNRRPYHFRRKIIRIVKDRKDLFLVENYYLQMIKQNELGKKYYNLQNKSTHWSADEKQLFKVRQKKIGRLRPEVGPAISTAKKGRPLSENHKIALRGIKKKPHTDEWKRKNSERMKKIWEERRTNKPPKPPKMSRAEQDKLCSQQLKNRWSDPIWAANQREKLKEGAKRRRAREAHEKLNS